MRPLRTVAEFFTEIVVPVVDEPSGNNDDDEETTSSSDSELEDLAAGVRRFEIQVANKQPGPDVFDERLDKDAKAYTQLSVEMELHRLVIEEEQAQRQSRLRLMAADEQ